MRDFLPQRVQTLISIAKRLSDAPLDLARCELVRKPGKAGVDALEIIGLLEVGRDRFVDDGFAEGVGEQRGEVFAGFDSHLAIVQRNCE